MLLFDVLKVKKNFLLLLLRAGKSDSFRESIQEKKQRTDTRNEAKKIKCTNFARSNREKSNIGKLIIR